MGASESRSQQEADDDGSTPPDYYTILEVDENASADEIKVSQSLASRHYGRITVYFFFWPSFSRSNGKKWNGCL